MLTCVCGEKRFEAVDKPAYEVSKAGVTARSDKPTALGKCVACGVIRQVKMPFDNEAEFVEYYRTKYAPVDIQYGAKDYQHDLDLARKRCADYGIGPQCQMRILDVGSGSGAFVDAARSHGAEAYGCEIGKYHYAGEADERFVYRMRFEDVNFPTDHFDMVVCHDVLEHVLDPVKFVGELFRVLKQDGTCMVDFPRYFHEAGRHHWKRFEHVWFFKPEDLQELFTKAGFAISFITNPIESKVLFQLTKPKQTRPSILLPPGIGDSYWSVVKLKAFLRREGLGVPDCGIVSPREKKWNGHMRAFPFLEMFPFLNSSEQFVEGKGKDLLPIWNEAYLNPGRTVFQDIAGFDYFISYNAHLRVGKSLDQIDPDLECDWSPPAFVSLAQMRCRENSIKRFGRYFVAYFVFQGTNQYLLEYFPLDGLIKLVCETAKKTKAIPVFVGAKWDLTDKKLARMIAQVSSEISGTVNLLGDTSLQQLFGLMKGAIGVVGIPSGISIMSAVMNLRTSILWSHWFPKPFIWNSCPPHTKEKTYRAVYSGDTTMEGACSETISILNDTPYERVPDHVRPPVPDPPPVPRRNNRGTVPRPYKFVQPKRPASAKAPEPKPQVTFACVLKTGGDFDDRYVQAMDRMLRKNVTGPYKFVCLTDLPSIDGIETIRLTDNLPGWWSKMEIFRPGIFNTKQIVYFDLDTVIIDNVDDLLLIDKDFCGLRPWNSYNRNVGRCASGMLSWKNGQFDFLYSQFRMADVNGSQQACMSMILQKNGVQFEALQDLIPGIYSYKRQCRKNLPEDARIVCFHGRPRVHEVAEGWVRRAWK